MPYMAFCMAHSRLGRNGSPKVARAAAAQALDTHMQSSSARDLTHLHLFYGVTTLDIRVRHKSLHFGKFLANASKEEHRRSATNVRLIGPNQVFFRDLPCFRCVPAEFRRKVTALALTPIAILNFNRNTLAHPKTQKSCRSRRFTLVRSDYSP